MLLTLNKHIRKKQHWNLKHLILVKVSDCLSKTNRYWEDLPDTSRMKADFDSSNFSSGAAPLHPLTDTKLQDFWAFPTCFLSLRSLVNIWSNCEFESEGFKPLVTFSMSSFVNFTWCQGGTCYLHHCLIFFQQNIMLKITITVLEIWNLVPPFLSLVCPPRHVRDQEGDRGCPQSSKFQGLSTKHRKERTCTSSIITVVKKEHIWVVNHYIRFVDSWYLVFTVRFFHEIEGSLVSKTFVKT